MILISILLLIIFIYAVYFAINDKIKGKKQIILAEAGDIHNITSETSNVTFSDLKFSKRGYIPFKVYNGCMDFVGINSGDIFFARELHNLSKNNISELIKFGDILLLKINDNGVIKHKIRMVDNVTANKDIETFYFIEKNGETYKHKSSENHKIEQVLGIVEYKKAE